MREPVVGLDDVAVVGVDPAHRSRGVADRVDLEEPLARARVDAELAGPVAARADPLLDDRAGVGASQVLVVDRAQAREVRTDDGRRRAGRVTDDRDLAAEDRCVPDVLLVAGLVETARERGRPDLGDVVGQPVGRRFGATERERARRAGGGRA